MANQPDKHLRAMLPIPDLSKPGLTTYDAKDPETKYPPIEPLRPPEGAPNVLVILIDDVGFGASSAFGGPAHTRPCSSATKPRSRSSPRKSSVATITPQASTAGTRANASRD